MKLRPFIDEIASQADDILSGITDRSEARTSLAEFVELEHPRFSPADRKGVVDGVMAVLDSEGFFGERYVDSFDADQNQDEESDS